MIDTKIPQLIGLNDYLQDINYSNIKNCLLQYNPATDKAIDINNITVSNNSTKEQIKNTLNIWGNILNVKPDECESRGDCNDKYEIIGQHKIDIISPFYAQLKAGGLFSDKYNNRIAIISSDNEIANLLYQRGYYGKEQEQIIINYNENDYTDESRYTGGGWKGRFANFMTFWKEGSPVILQRLENVGINKRKLDKIVIVKLGRDKGIDFSSVLSYIVDIASLAVAAIPGVGTTLAVAIQSGMQIAKNYAINPNYSLDSKELLQMGTALLPNLTSGDSDLNKYLNKGAGLYQAIQNQDYKYLVNEFGFQETFAKVKIKSQLQNDIIDKNDVRLLLDVAGSNGKKLNYNEVNSVLQNERNISLTKQFAEVTNNKQSKYLEELYSKGLDESQQWQKFLVAYAGGGYTSALPTMTKDNDAIINIMNIDSSWKQSPEIHKAFLNIALSLPTGTAAFDELLILNIENQVKNSIDKTITLPAQIPAEKARCIAKELSTNGYKVITSEYQAFYKDNKPSIPSLPSLPTKETEIFIDDISIRNEWR